MEPLAQWSPEGLTPHTLDAVTAIAIAAGTLYCFLGYRLLKTVIALTGFILAGGAAAFLAAWFSQGQWIVTSAALLLGGLSGAVALLFTFKVGVFLLGMLGAAAIAHAAQASGVVAAVPWIIIAAAVAGGLTALYIERPIITVATAATGAWIVVAGFAYFILGRALPELPNDSGASGKTRWMILAAWAGLASAGIITQFATPKTASAARKG